MKKTEIILRCVYLLTAAVIIFNLVYSVRDSLFFNLDDLPAGQKILAVNSPEGDKTLTLYLVENSLGTAIRAAVCDTPDGEPYNIYWQTGTDLTDAVWLADGVVQINNVMIDPQNGGTYDCRRGYSLFQEGSFEGEDSAQE